MNNRLYVENLPAGVTESSLRELFSQEGQVLKVQMVLDPVTGISRGRAFVTMATEEVAQKALKALASHLVQGRNIAVNMARPVETAPAGLISHGFDTGRGERQQQQQQVPRRMGRNAGRGNRRRR